MKKQFITEAKRFQELAGIITENVINEELKNIQSDLEDAGFEFDDGILGGVGSGGAGYYDGISDKISGYNLDKFDEEEFNKWYDNFSKDDLNSSTYEKEDFEDNEINSDIINKFQPGIYLVGGGDQWGLGYAEIHENGNVTLFAIPSLSDDDGEEFIDIFSLNKDGSINKEIDKEEVKNYLNQNISTPGSWGII
jgi:hypothetical protein